MKEPEPFIVNKYGAVESTTILKLIDRVEKLEELITDYRKTLIVIHSELFGLDLDFSKEWSWDKMLDYDKGLFGLKEAPIEKAFKDKIKENESVIKKLRLLTKADDYEYITETKLVKKEKKEK